MNLFYMQDWLAWRLQGFYPERLLLRITNKETTSLLNPGQPRIQGESIHLVLTSRFRISCGRRYCVFVSLGLTL